MLMYRCVYILKWRGLTIPYKYIVTGAYPFEIEIVLDKNISLFYGTAENDCLVFRVILSEDGVESVLNDVKRVVVVGRYNHTHGELVFWSGEIYPLVGVCMRFWIILSIVEAETVLMIDDCLKNWVFLAKQGLKGNLIPMLLFKLSN